MDQDTSKFRAELSGRPPEPIRVGAGTAFYLSGTLEAPEPPQRVRLRFGDDEREVDAHSMPPERSYGGGGLWWSLVAVPGPVQAGPVAVALVLTGSGGETVLSLGEVVLAAAGEGQPEPVAAPVPVGGEPLIAICMATYEPDPDRLRVQLDSIRAQTRGGWICAISDDCSSPEAFAELDRQVGGDERFVVSRSPERLGFIRNFERAIAMAPRSAELIALADQDDRWDDDKLAALAAALEASPSSLLAYSDVRIADRAGRILSDTYFFERRNNAASMASMMITNNVTGAASLLRRELLETALPFPPGGTGQELYHDHWLALCALAGGPLAYLDRPTHDYTRHDASVTISDADGHWVAPPRDRRDAVRMRARRLARRLRLAARSPGWRSAYTGRYLLIRQLATILLLRRGRGGIDPRHRRDIDRLLAAERSPGAAAWLVARSFRPWIGRNDTLARERLVCGGILWRKLVGRRRASEPARRSQRRSMTTAALARAIVWRRLASIRRALSPPSQPPPPAEAGGETTARGAATTAAEAGWLTPVVIDYFGRDGSTAMLKLLATSPEVVVEGGYPFELQQLAHALRSEQPEATWGAYCRTLAAGTRPLPRFYAEKMLDARNLDRPALPPLRMIVLLRDPRDTYVSIEAFSRAVGAEELGGVGHEAERLDRFVERQRLRLEWIARLRRDRTTLVVGYEQLAVDLPAAAAAVSEWLGVDLDPAAVAGDFRLRWVHGTSPEPRRSVGRWRDQLPEPVLSRLRRELGAAMLEVGYREWDR